MPEVSRRLVSLSPQGQDGWEIYREARERNLKGEGIIELTIGEPDVKTDPSILDAMHASARGGQTGYPVVPGTDALRTEIARRVQSRTGVRTVKNNVLVTPGAQMALFATHLLTAGDGSAALHVDPYYPTYPGTIRSAGARPVSVPTSAANGFLPNEQALDAAWATYRARSLLINSPNNPTGVVYPAATIEAIARVVQRNDGWLISDEVYDTQVWEGNHVSPRSLPGMMDHTLVVGSMSKSHAMTGSRVGWIIGPERVIEALRKLAVVTTYGVPGYIQDAALYALQMGPTAERKVCEPFLRRRNMLLDIAKGYNQLELVRPTGAMYAFLDIRKTGLSGEDFARKMMNEQGVAVMPGESFGRCAAGHIRMSLTVKDAQLQEALPKVFAMAVDLAKQKS
ncbi:pyridoxal phosphate-dependent aminotransferase [Pseudoprimorskyibacter insulae]|uniref:Aminotransferase n=1 Tax=Pseudoprimorskyibacter insulae TaxID=1695997 RepID=A0A2R8AWA5_9RHOB|nr:pyridoxal phosphate-dependent aminotransferase [Pseudoprimorskyibacter insulae]SPF80164.1 Arginine--pyruvate transaminase AruH [Pseudoprimorskyibacter insulae]